MMRLIAIIVVFSGLIVCNTPLWSQQIGQIYYNSETTLSWWERVTNRYDWIRQRLGTRYKFERSVGVVIAISDYKDTSDFKDLASPTKDAIRMKDFLLNEAGFDEVHMLVDDDATSSNIRDLMERSIPRIVGDNDRLLVYWSGHGGSAKDSIGRDYGFLALQEATEDGRIDSIHMDDTRRWLRRIKARQVLFVFDTCYSGLALQTASSPTDPVWEQLAGPSQFLLTSSSASQESYGHTDGTGGLFTSAFLEGARGAADTNRDGLATITEIAAHLETRLATGLGFVQSSQIGPIGRQEGRFFFLSGQEVILTPLPEPSSVESTGGICGEVTADYTSFVRQTQVCEVVKVFLETHATAAECMAYQLATRQKEIVCANVDPPKTSTDYTEAGNESVAELTVLNEEAQKEERDDNLGESVPDTLQKLGIEAELIEKNTQHGVYKVTALTDRRSQILKTNYLIRFENDQVSGAERLNLEYARNNTSKFRPLVCKLRAGGYYQCVE